MARVTVEDCLELLVINLRLFTLPRLVIDNFTEALSVSSIIRTKMLFALREIAAGKVRFREELSELTGSKGINAPHSMESDDNEIFGDAPLV